MIISRKRFNKEVEKRVQEEMKRAEEWHWREDRERERCREMRDLEIRLIKCEKSLNIDHPSHNTLEAARAAYY